MRDKEFGSQFDFRNPPSFGLGFIDTPPGHLDRCRDRGYLTVSRQPAADSRSDEGDEGSKGFPTFWYDTGAGDKRGRGMS